MDSKQTAKSPAKRKSPEPDFKAHVGEGSFGKVYKSQYHDTVIKIIPAQRIGQVSASFVRESMFLSMVAKKPLCLHMEKCKALAGQSRMSLAMYKGDLFDEVNKEAFTLKDKYMLFFTLAKSVYSVHSMGIIHGDIKPENFLFNSPQDIAIADFGLSSLSNPLVVQLNTSARHTLQFRAPEILSGLLNNRRKSQAMINEAIQNKTFTSEVNNRATELAIKDVPYSGNIDVWSLGIVFYALIRKRPSYGFAIDGKSNQDPIVQTLEAYDRLFHPNALYSWLTEDLFDGDKTAMEEFKVLIKGMLCIDPSKRMSITDVLNSKFISYACQTAWPGEKFKGPKIPNILNNLSKYSRSSLPYAFPNSVVITEKLTELKYPLKEFNINPRPRKYRDVVENYLATIMLCNSTIPLPDFPDASGNATGNASGKTASAKLLEDIEDVMHHISLAIYNNEDSGLSFDEKRLALYNIFGGKFFYPVIGVLLISAYENHLLSLENTKLWLDISVAKEFYNYDPIILLKAIINWCARPGEEKNVDTSEIFIYTRKFIDSVAPVPLISLSIPAKPSK